VRYKTLRSMSSPDESLERFAGELQETILREALRRYGPTVIDHWMNPRRWGPLPNPDGYARYPGSCGDTMQVWLRVVGDRIDDCSFMTDGCGSSIACGSALCELALGRTMERAAELDDEAILKHLGGLPQEDVHCAVLAATTFFRALDDFVQRQRPEKPP
jgi:nitrogen fixation NifU-like protein